MTRRALGPVLASTVLLLGLVAGCGVRTPVSPPVVGRGLDPVPSTAAGEATWSPWPSALHDARHSGATTADGPTAGAVRWRRTLEGAVSSGPVVARDGTVYAESNGGVLHALDPATGADRWTFDAGRGGGDDLSTSALVLPDGTVLWGPPGQRVLVALSPGGALLWTQPFPGEPTSPVSADGRRVYVGDTTGGVAALEVGGGDMHRVAWASTWGRSPMPRWSPTERAGCTAPSIRPWSPSTTTGRSGRSRGGPTPATGSPRSPRASPRTAPWCWGRTAAANGRTCRTGPCGGRLPA